MILDSRRGKPSEAQQGRQSVAHGVRSCEIISALRFGPLGKWQWEC